MLARVSTHSNGCVGFLSYLLPCEDVHTFFDLAKSALAKRLRDSIIADLKFFLHHYTLQK